MAFVCIEIVRARSVLSCCRSIREYNKTTHCDHTTTCVYVINLLSNRQFSSILPFFLRTITP